MGLPSTQTLSSLTAADAQVACDSLAETFFGAVSDDDLARYSCTLLAVVFNIGQGPDGMPMVNQAACEQMVATCVADTAANPGTIQTEDNCTPASLMSVVTGCDATVGDLNACLAASIAGLNGQLNTLSCDAPISIGGPSLMTPPDPAECTALEAQCPGILARLEEETGVGVPSLEDGGGGTGGEPVGPGGCTNTCSDADDGFCDDGGEGSTTDWCAFGSDCGDCGERPAQ
jgi:hypothetical protein